MTAEILLVAQHSKPQPETLVSRRDGSKHSAVPLLIQLHVIEPGTAAEDGPHAWTPGPMEKTHGPALPTAASWEANQHVQFLLLLLLLT